MYRFCSSVLLTNISYQIQKGNSNNHAGSQELFVQTGGLPSKLICTIYLHHIFHHIFAPYQPFETHQLDHCATMINCLLLLSSSSKFQPGPRPQTSNPSDARNVKFWFLTPRLIHRWLTYFWKKTSNSRYLHLPWFQPKIVATSAVGVSVSRFMVVVVVLPRPAAGNLEH